MPGTYDSSPVHGEPGNRHVDIITRDERGQAEEGSKHHVSLSDWIWGKGGDEGGGGSKDPGHVMGG